MKKDTSYSFQSKKGMEVTFDELHIRHINLLIDIKNKELNNWFLKMAIINTFDDLKIFLNNLKKNKNKCIIAIYGNEIIGYLNIFPLNKKGYALALLSQCFAMGYFFGPFISGRVLDLFGYASIIWLSISCCCFIAFAILFKRLF